MQVLKQKREDKVEVKLLALHRAFRRCGLARPISAAAHGNTRLSMACKLISLTLLRLLSLLPKELSGQLLVSN